MAAPARRDRDVLRRFGRQLGGRAGRPGRTGKQIFRSDTFGDEIHWTDTLRIHEVISTSVDPTTALSVGLKVDAEALPAAATD